MFNPVFNVLKSIKKEKLKKKGFKAPPSMPKPALPITKKLPKGI